MSRTPVLLLGIFLAWSLAGCAPQTGHKAEFFVFGTLVEVQLPEAGETEAAELFGQLQREFQRMHREWHAWEPGELLDLNASLQAGVSTRTTPDLLDLIRRSQALERLSEGRFNPAIGKLIASWGFHTSNYPIQGPPPSPDEIQRLLVAHPSSLDIRIDGGLVQTDNPLVQLDFGGIAKGYAIDRAIEIILQHGQDSAIVNAGGDMRAIGDNAGRDWRVGVQDPRSGVAGGIQLESGAAVFTSGNYTRFREDARQRYAHILDPRTGWPVNSVAAATVISDNGTTADAAATAIMVAGSEDWPAVAARMGVTAAMVIDESGVIHATPAMMDFFTAADGREVRIVTAN